MIPLSPRNIANSGQQPAALAAMDPRCVVEHLTVARPSHGPMQ